MVVNTVMAAHAKPAPVEILALHKFHADWRLILLSTTKNSSIIDNAVVQFQPRTYEVWRVADGARVMYVWVLVVLAEVEADELAFIEEIAGQGSDSQRRSQKNVENEVHDACWINSCISVLITVSFE